MIELEDVGYSYGGATRGPLLRDMTLTLRPGSFHFLTGPSGAGKTTFLKLCYGELRPTLGRLALFGEDLGTTGRDALSHLRRRIGVVHQDCRFLDHLTVTENIALPLQVSGEAVAEQRDNIQELLAWVGLSERSGAYPPELSGGERQRAALARALILSPDVILADEPTGNVDWEMSQRLLQLLVALNDMGKAVMIASHDLMLIRAAKAQVQARVLRIAGGALQTAGADL